jgi:exodeoxyribonuclease VII large subunit
LQQQLLSARERLNATQRTLHARGPQNTLEALRQRHHEATRRLQACWQISAQFRRDRLAATARQLNALSPLAVMQRGYSVLKRLSDGSVISSVTEVAVEERLAGLLQDGTLNLRVERKIESNGGD